MASFTVDTSVEPMAAIRDKVEPVLHYLRYHDKNYTFLHWARKNIYKSHDGGKFIIQSVMGTEASDYKELKTGLERISTDRVAEQDAIRIQIGAGAKPVVGKKIDIEVYNRESPQRVFNYWLEKVKTASLNIKKQIATALFSTNSAAGTINGLLYGISTTGVQAYGGYTYPTALVNQYSATTTVVSPSNMHKMLMDCNHETDAIFTTKALYSAYWACRAAHERYTPVTGQSMASMGAPVLAFNDIPVAWDLCCPALHMFYASKGSAETQDMYLWISPAWDFKLVKVADRTAEQEVEIARYLVAMQLTIPNRQHQGVLHLLTR